MNALAPIPRHERVDFRAVSDAALAALNSIVPRMLPGGRVEGEEWVVRNPTRNDGKPGSFKVNLRTGVWSDFATNEAGGDAIDLLVYLEGKTKLEAARDLAQLLNVKPGVGSTSLTGNVRPIQPRKSSALAMLPTLALVAPISFPARTKPDQDGKPRFVVAGDEGPRIRSDEKRRHVYTQGGVPIRIKIIRNDGDAFNVFRVTDTDGKTGWQYRRPEGFAAVPYVVGGDPFDNSEQPIFWPEGEKDVETLAKLGLPAFTFGGTGDGLPDGCAAYVSGRALVILSDNDKDGRMHADCKAVAAHDVAASVRIVHFPDTADKGDVTDWVALYARAGADLAERADATAVWQFIEAGRVWIEGDGPSAEPDLQHSASLPEVVSVQIEPKPAASEAPDLSAQVATIPFQSATVFGAPGDGGLISPAPDLGEISPKSPAPDLDADQPSNSQLDTKPDAKKLKLPAGYSFSERGLMWQSPDDLDKPAMWIAGHLDIEAETRDADGGSWGVLLRWLDHDNREHTFALPRGALAGDGSEARRLLMDGGFFIAPSQAARGVFNSFLLLVRSPNRARATQRVGWHGNTFVLPDHCFGNDASDVLLLQSATAQEHSFRQLGTLESWQQNVARYAIGNSRLALAISAAFAGPLVGPCSAEGGGLHFLGASSTGKSTALHVAGSVWGGGDDANGYIRSWRATANGLEGVSLGHSDTLLCLDELSQLDARDAGAAAYMLANGAGKSRSSRDGSAKKPARWRVLFLSSGEIGLADKVAEDGRGKKLAAGQQVRIVDIAADAGGGMGMFENLHGFASAEILARHLRAATQHHYGVAARHYLAAVVPSIEDLRKQIAIIMKAFCEQYVPAGADGQIERVAQRFALVAVGGELAQQHGIVPWPAGEAIAAAGRCFNDWLAARGGHDAAESRDGIEQVRSFLSANGMARFVPAWEHELDNRTESRIPPRDVAGYRQKTGDGWDYFVTTSAWKEEVCRGFDARRLAATMAERGYINAPDSTRRAAAVYVPGQGKMRLYHVRSSLLEDAQ